MVIKCEERYQEAMAYAKKTTDKTLQNCLDRLKQYEMNADCEVYLYKDFAPLSFYFELKDNAGKRIMNGGLLFHGNPDESFAVQMIQEIGWQIHT
ncbi:hypothetical protein M2451_004198 [Dysgonomonas sp. PFB1-18]|uniref:DUF4120 family protein n=1 Tax=unclassified Dysgonomonas TaxID=2630389 RepID=UPI0024739D2A|nr:MULTISPECIES: DUF4120 family protein [unclassified Dysgonomonas]MDH6309455.1 hypothetical protein [Dysgonomonas sp. PF1-14]MDH6341146.1 hypothetical protein [Dysgonomonas sp. PF1-16]MDH6382843.1 hypothetical protein [Dysgonomonas sp. PFB1-18]